MSTKTDDLTPTASPASSGERRVRIEPNHRRVRAVVDGRVVADSTRTIYLFETGHLPVYYFPLGDIAPGVLIASDHRTHCPYKGDASYWTLQVGDRVIPDAVWGYANPIEGCPDISGYVALYWNRVDQWFEEDDEVFVHARDPYKRIDVLHSSRHVEVTVGGVVVADTRRPRLLFETGLPVRYYVPKLDVRLDLLTPSSTRTRCPYKGEAIYWNVTTPTGTIDDIAWSYPTPLPESGKIENLICFYNERVDAITIDGEVEARPVTPWTR